MRSAFPLFLPLVLVGAAACHRQQVPERVAQGYLFEKGPYQGFYDGNGKLTRLLYDQNGDKKADVVMLFYPNGRPKQVEADTDFDGKIDRWQYYSENGVPEKEGYSRRGGAQPDTWQYFDAKGNLTRREVDEDGDGKIERWQTWVGGRVVSEELDTDGDGISDRRLRYGANGHLVGMDILNARSTKVAAPAPAIAR